MYRRLSTILLLTIVLLAALVMGVTAQDAVTDDGGSITTFLSAEPDNVTIQAQTPTTVTISVPISVPIVDPDADSDAEGESITVTLAMSMDTQLSVSLAPPPVAEEMEPELESTETMTDTAEVEASEAMTDTEEMVESEAETEPEAEANMDDEMVEDMDGEMADAMADAMADYVHIQEQVPVYVDVMVAGTDGEMMTVTVPIHVDVDLMVSFDQIMLDEPAAEETAPAETEEEATEEEATEEAAAEEEAAPAEEEAPAEEAAEESAGLAEPYITIARSRVNLRGGPGTNFPVVGTASQGEQFAVVGKNAAGNWFEFRRDDESTAWIADFIVTLSGDADDIDVSENIPEPQTAPAPAAPSTGTSGNTASSSGAGLSGKLLYSVANMDAGQWELWEYTFATGNSIKISDWRTEVAVSPDNSQIAYFAWPGDVGDDVGIYIMDSNLTNNRLLVYGGSYPSFNPGGDQLVVQGGEDIYVVSSDGASLRQLTRGEYPAWSPISNEIVHRACVGGSCGLWIIDAYSSDPNAKRQLTTGGSDGQPAWSPDGRQIAYISQEDGTFDIYVINADGTGQRRAFAGPTSDGLPVWSPDGQWIAFRSDMFGSWAIFAVRPDGSNLRKLVDANVLDRWFFEKMAWRR